MGPSMTSEVSERFFDTADQLWKYLSVGRLTASADEEVIYRGHADANWLLVPTVLRKDTSTLFEGLVGSPLNCEEPVWMEFQMLRSFVYGCDAAGVAVPNDSIEFREEHLTTESFWQYHRRPSEWPNTKLLELMAMARLHGLPTRLLDWSTHPYVAAYFAAGEALHADWSQVQSLAIIEFNKGPRRETYCGNVRILRVRGAISANLVAQHGLFTVHPFLGRLGDPVDRRQLGEHLPAPPQSSLLKLTLPIEESIRLYELCDEFKFNAARIYPGADGASRSVAEEYQYALKSETI